MGLLALVRDAVEDFTLIKIMSQPAPDLGPFTMAADDWPKRCDWCGDITGWFSRKVHNQQVCTGVWGIPNMCRACTGLVLREDEERFTTQQSPQKGA